MFLEHFMFAVVALLDLVRPPFHLLHPLVEMVEVGLEHIF
jgi:hypothetical protein